MMGDAAEVANRGHGQGSDEDRDRRRDQEAVSRFVERFAGELTDAGMQRMASRVFAALLASDSGAMTSAELAEQLRISPAAISGAVRYLTHVNMIGREREPGSRRDRYRLYSDVWYETLTRRDQLLTRWEGILREGAATLGPGTPAGARVAETAEFMEFLQKEFHQILTRWREHKATPREGGPAGE
ncbi:MarR family transcriptional regulator [Streptomyces sp. NPDC046261]|uniref:GbsR/MarR family transcriptional regulator n=1 Tax=Streptomyces sp. NPDC046261 TaxID=3157200 RepID=UPI0033EC0511